ncbi:Serine/threonine-protein kinase STY13 [Linum grandiflorum]
MHQSNLSTPTSDSSFLEETSMSEASSLTPVTETSSAAAATTTTSNGTNLDDDDDEELVLDVSGKSLELDMFDYSMQQSNSSTLTSDSSFVEETPMSEASALTATDSSPSAATTTASNGTGVNDDLVLDVSGKSLELDMFDQPDDSLNGLYVYKNVFSLLPRSVGRLDRLRTFKFFGNEVNLFPADFGNLVGLECLQVKMSSPGLNGMRLDKLRGLKELELSKVPPRPSVLTILTEISGLKSLTKLSVCHFSIRYLPPEIGCLRNLEFLDLSFNKLKSLPTEISHLSALLSLKVANNKLVELPVGLSLLQKLESLDLSNNRLTSLGSLELGLMHNLFYLNLQCNKLFYCCEIPSWICCNLEGNIKDSSKDDFASSSVEMDVYETFIPGDENNVTSSRHASSSLSNGHLSNGRCSASQRSSKRWKRHHYLQQKARQERLNSSRKGKGEGCIELLVPVGADNSSLDGTEEIHEENSLEMIVNNEDKEGDIILKVEGEGEGVDLVPSFEDDKISNKEELCIENCASNSESITRDVEKENCVPDESFTSTVSHAGTNEQVESSSLDSKIPFKPKRHSEADLANPKPCKCPRARGDSLTLSRKYNDLSFCSIEDNMPDGFYDAGRDRPIMPLWNYDEILPLDAREVILLDRKRDEILDATVLSAQALVSRTMFSAQDRSKAAADDLSTVLLLAMFVSDHFGGSDKSATVQRMRKAVSGSNYTKPFVCTCSTGNLDGISSSQTSLQIPDSAGEINLADICDRSLSSIKARQNSVVIPLGNLKFGVCRHRSLLMKVTSICLLRVCYLILLCMTWESELNFLMQYLCDRMDPPIPCELVRGYLDFTPHAWNIVILKRAGSLVRMVVDACTPYDIREETDPEYFCRYIPLSRINVHLLNESLPAPDCSFPSLSTSDELEKTASSTVKPCKIGSVEAVAKLRTLDTGGKLADEIRNFEQNCLGEVRMLGALQHPCIIKTYGHKISSQWVFSEEGRPECRVLQSAIFMEYVKGGSLKSYLEKLSEAGDKHVPVDIALCIAQNVACALAELHSKHVIHRDIKSENILMDFDGDGLPTVKLCDFDRAVPLRSSLHTCCIAHRGIPPPNLCVGTPRWMAPEVLRAMHEHQTYGLEVDIWSYGCLLSELLTLSLPYSDVPEQHIHELLESGRRPPLTDDLEELANVPAGKEKSKLETEWSGEQETLRFLVNLFRQCTEGNPLDRPTANDIYESLIAHTDTINSRKLRSNNGDDE